MIHINNWMISNVMKHIFGAMTVILSLLMINITICNLTKVMEKQVRIRDML